MKVYVAFRDYYYEGSEVLGVYATQGAAEAGCEEERKMRPYLTRGAEWSVKEFELLGTSQGGEQ